MTNRDSGNQTIERLQIEQNETTFSITFLFTPASSKIMKNCSVYRQDVIDENMSNK